MDINLPSYDEPRRLIENWRKNGIEWDIIEYARKRNDDDLQEFLNDKNEFECWPKMTSDEWKTLVNSKKEAHKRAQTISFRDGFSLIHRDNEVNEIEVPTDSASSWQLYRKKLLNDGFKPETVDQIEKAAIGVLRNLSKDTTESGPVKGVVVGNVQSGKTANMAAVMAMAADWGWNMFVILSGTIENLRIQTQKRLFNDLNQPGNLYWRCLEHLSKNVEISQRLQNIHLDSRERYFTVCIKQQNRLSNLIQWAQEDPAKQKQLKILVIDDEADQASVNTGNTQKSDQERKKINRLICNLVEGRDEEGNERNVKYQAMNYVGYTATPYANFLNESSEESLYPKDFIMTLPVSKEYFGPQQIFGYEGEDDSTYFEGINIVRDIPKEELDMIKEVHRGSMYDLPDTLVDAISWFMCGVSCMRLWGYRKPISMLVHTSQKTDHHQMLSDAISNWFETNTEEDIIARAKKVWDKESSEFTLDKLYEQYPSYDRPKDKLNDYPDFSEIEEQIRIMLNDGVAHIQLGDRGDLEYNKGIHLCIDNCKQNGIDENGMYVRLAYPDKNQMPELAPAFIVVGGATLSRGLTLEGLISTYFLRTVGQADTLMQMGRWFGYRKGYEIIPRLWLTEKTRKQFAFLAELDQELRDEIQYMDINGRIPAEYGPRVKNSPKVSFIRITARNKMQNAIASEMDYSGASNQTYLFDDDPDLLSENIDVTEEFIGTLGEEWEKSGKEKYNKDAAVWKNVEFSKVRNYIEKFKFQSRLKVFNDTTPLLNWIESITNKGKLGDWNVVVAGISKDTNGTWKLPNGRVINKVKRTRKVSKTEMDDGVIDIGALRAPCDLLSDIDLSKIEDDSVRQEVEDYINSGNTRQAMAFRDKSGLETTPQLLIYRVDKDSKASKNPSDRVKTRVDLNASEDLVGICLYIPGGRIGTSYASSVSVRLKNDIFDGDADVEGANEN